MVHQLRKLALVLILLFVTVSFSTASPTPFEFALPELEGTLSLGIYDRSGKLIRTLARHASVCSFQIGVNGLNSSWDGLTDDGKQALPGRYEVRGFVVGSMKVDAVKFHFNDWVEKNDGPFPITILSVLCAPNGGLVLLWNTFNGHQQLAYYTNFQTLQWVKNIGKLESSKPLLGLKAAAIGPLLVGIQDDEISVLNGDRLSFFSMENGSQLRAPVTLSFAPISACRKDSKFLLVAPGRLSGITDSGTEWPIAPPDSAEGKIAEVFNTPNGFVTLSPDGIVQEWNQGSWHRIPLPVLAKKVTPGYENTIWLIAESPDKKEFLGQFSIQGEFLRKVHLPPDEVTSSLAAPPDEDKIFLLRSKWDRSSYLIGYQFVKSPESQTTICQEFFRKTIVPSSRFGFSSSGLTSTDVSTHVVPASSPVIEFPLVRDALNPQPGAVWLQAKVEGDTAWLATEDGLPLLPIGELQGLSRVFIAKKALSEIPVVFGGNGATVAEFSIQGISNLQPLDIGSISKK